MRDTHTHAHACSEMKRERIVVVFYWMYAEMKRLVMVLVVHSQMVSNLANVIADYR